MRVYEYEKVTLPTKRQLEKKKAQIEHLVSQPMTDVSSILEAV